MRHPEKVPDDPSHRRASHPIKQADDGQWAQRADVLRSKCRNDTGEQEARQGNILSKKENFGQHRRSTNYTQYYGSGITTSSRRTSTIWAPPRAASVGKSFALLNINPAPTVKKLKATERVRDDTEFHLPFE